MDRYIFAVLLELIKQEIRVSDAAPGLLASPCFAANYTIVGVPIARMADLRAALEASIAHLFARKARAGQRIDDMDLFGGSSGVVGGGISNAGESRRSGSTFQASSISRIDCRVTQRCW